MKQSYADLHDYHTLGHGIDVKQEEWPSVRAALLFEQSNEVQFTKTRRSSLVLTLDGTASHMTKMEGINDNSPSSPGEISFIPENANMTVAWQNHAPLQKSIVLEFDTCMFRNYVPEIVTQNFERGHLIPTGFQRQPNFELLLRIIGQEVETGGQSGRIFAESAIRLLAIQVASHGWTYPTASKGYGLRPDARACRAIEYIEVHYSRDISLLEIAAAAGLSLTQLTQVFQQATGQTPYSYVIARRLRQAVHLLRTSDLSIAHIALDVGFADQAHLTRTFQRRYGSTPKVVRNQR